VTRIAIDREDYEEWLREKYSEVTVQESLSAVDGILRALDGDGEIAQTQWARAKRLLRYSEDRGLSLHRFPALVAATSNERIRAATKASRKRQLEARAFDDGAWLRIGQAIIGDPDRESRVLEVMMISALRAGDVLRIKTSELFESTETGELVTTTKGGKRRVIAVRGVEALEDALVRLSMAILQDADESRRNPKDITGWLVPDSQSKLPITSARKAVYRKLKEIGAANKVRGRIHLHRMRRTIAVQALRATGDLATVGQLLGHTPRSVQSTLKYLDEARLDDVGHAMNKVHQQFLKGQKKERE